MEQCERELHGDSTSALCSAQEINGRQRPVGRSKSLAQLLGRQLKWDCSFSPGCYTEALDARRGRVRCPQAAFSKVGRSHSLRHSHEPGQEPCNTDGTPRERPLVLASSINN